eukprot:TRINITY_DN4347_c0_g3_i1.p1 TRINITY_DN4347_c0_g3~~TRINITY_DN4347_c0_g3_i1.p1  ORF type:complete len:188 (+),score=16.81 TRINITY_DN4347_c0_g3_i1:46-609(+)
MLRRCHTLLKLELENVTSSATGYSKELKPTFNAKRGINFRYSKESQNIREMEIESRKGLFRTVKDELKDSDPTGPAFLSTMLDLPSKMYNHDDKNYQSLAEVHKANVLPLPLRKRKISTRQQEKFDQARELRYMALWIFLWALLGSQAVHYISPVKRDLPIITNEEIDEYIKSKRQQEEKEKEKVGS